VRLTKVRHDADPLEIRSQGWRTLAALHGVLDAALVENAPSAGTPSTGVGRRPSLQRARPGTL
jgi:hypothetical protein